MKQLTIKEAIEQGYTKYGFYERDWQTAEDLHDGVFEEVEEEEWDSLVLFDKECNQPKIEERKIAEILSEHIGECDSEECQRDDDEVYKAVEEIDYTNVQNEINKVLSKFKYWMLTDIKLVK